MIRSRSYSAASRRALVRISIGDGEAVSSIKIDVSPSVPLTRVNSSHSESSIWPRRKRWESIPVCEAIMRCTNCSADISSVKMATTALYLERRVAGHRHGQAGLAHARSRGDDDEIRRL